MVRSIFKYMLRSGKSVKRDMEVQDVRSAQLIPQLDVNGAELWSEATRVLDFTDEATVLDVYYQECRDILARKYPDAARVFILDHNIRHQTLAGHPLRSVPFQEGCHFAATYNPPVLFVHNDWSDVSAPQRLRGLIQISGECDSREPSLDTLTASELDELESTCDYKFVNVWRSIGPEPVQDRHLAFVDGRTLDEKSVIRSDEILGDGVGAVCYFEPSPMHEWLYWDRMDTSEAMLLKCYDSCRADGLSREFCRFTAHSSFVDPTAPSTAAPRQSIEVRAAVFLLRPHMTARVLPGSRHCAAE